LPPRFENLVGALGGMDESVPNKSSFTRARQRLGAFSADDQEAAPMTHPRPGGSAIVDGQGTARSVGSPVPAAARRRRPTRNLLQPSWSHASSLPLVVAKPAREDFSL
jgi:hypothetical protein